MALCGGKYNAETDAFREQVGLTEAEMEDKPHGGGTVIFVFNGAKGHGVEVQITEDIAPLVPAMLRKVADQIEQDFTMKFEH